MTNKQRKALGRGFGALLKAVDDKNPDESSTSIAQLDIDKIGLNPKQPRQEMDPARLEDLAQSIRIKGVIQPILVRPKNDSGNAYELVAGENDDGYITLRIYLAYLAGNRELAVQLRDAYKDRNVAQRAERTTYINEFWDWLTVVCERDE